MVFYFHDLYFLRKVYVSSISSLALEFLSVIPPICLEALLTINSLGVKKWQCWRAESQYFLKMTRFGKSPTFTW